MPELELLPTLLIFVAGLSVGVIAMLIVNKISSGSVSASNVKKEMDDYQGQVEAHFEETSQKFKDMAAQYQDLYQHLSVGATTLCRPENMVTGLSDQSNPLEKPVAIESKLASDQAKSTDKADVNKKSSADTNTESSAEKVKESSAKVGKEPSAKVDKEPSADANKKPSADVGKKPSAEKVKEPSVEAIQKPAKPGRPKA